MPPSIFRPKRQRLGVIPSRVLTGGLITNATTPVPYADWLYKFNHVLPSETFPSAQTALPVPIRGTIPELATALESSRADLLDLRIVDSEGAEVLWSGTINATTGVYDLWVKHNWSSTSDNALTCYIGNADADAPTEGVTWPTGWESLWYRDNFMYDMIGSFDLGAGDGTPTITNQGLVLNGSSHVRIPYSSAMHQKFLDVGTDNFCWFMVWKPTQLAHRGGLIAVSPDGTYVDEVEIEQSVDNTVFFQVRKGSSPTVAVNRATGAVALNTVATIGIRRTDTSWQAFKDGTPDAGTTGFQENIYHDSTEAIQFGRYFTNIYGVGELIGVLFFRATVPTNDQLIILDHLLRTPATYNETDAALTENT